MATVDSAPLSPEPPPPDDLSVFVDTNLDTHLAVLLSSDDTVADLKGKIKTEHALCFPKIGEVSVHAMKVRRRASFYHLSDSVPVKSVFSGIKGAWFLYLDLVPTTPIVKTQMETVVIVVSESGGQAEKHDVIQTTGCDVSGEDMNQDASMNGLPTEKSFVQISVSNVHENEELADIVQEKSLAQGDSSLPHISGPQIHNAVASSNDELVSGIKSGNGNIEQNDLNFNLGVSPSGYDRRPNSGVQDMDLVTEGDGAVGSNHQQKSEQAACHGNKDGKGGNHGNIGGGAEVDLEVLANSGRSRKKAKIEKDTSRKNDASSVKPVNEEKFDGASGTGHDKLNNISDKAMTDADLGNKNATKCGIPSELSVRSPQKRSKKRRETELPNTQSITQETDNSSRDQVAAENQHKTSTIQEHPGKEFKGAAIPADAAASRHSAVVESTSLSSPTEGKQRRRRKKSEKVELHHEESNLQSNAHETVKSSRDKVMEEFSKGTSGSHLEHPGNEPKAAAVDDSTAVQSVLPSDPTDKKPKRSRKKSGKIELPSGQPTMAESVHFLVDKVTKEKPKESLEEYKNEESGSQPGHPGKEPEGPAVPLSSSDKKLKRSRKKLGKTEFPGKEATKEKAGGTLNGSRTGMGENSNSEAMLREVAGILINFQDAST